MRKVGEAAKCHVNLQAKMFTTDIRAANRIEAEATASAKTAEASRQTVIIGPDGVVVEDVDADMEDTSNTADAHAAQTGNTADACRSKTADSSG